MRKCYSCERKIADTVKFCPYCGKSIDVTKEMVERAAAGEADAQTELFHRTYNAVYNKIKTMVQDEETAQDLLQDTYFRAFIRLNQLKDPIAFPGWLLTIARNLTINWYKKNSRQKNIVLFF